MAEETIEVYHITDIDNIPSIVEQGLKTEYAVAGKKATLFNKYSLLIQEELKKEEPNRPIIDRDKILYARIFERKKKQLEKLREHIKGLAIVIFDVNPNDVYIGDDSIITAVSLLTAAFFCIFQDFSDFFDEADPAVLWMIKTVIERAHKVGAKVGLCGQAPSNNPEFARKLVEYGIDTISVTPDSFFAVKQHVSEAEGAWQPL